MGWIEENMKSTQIRQILYQAISLGPFLILSISPNLWNFKNFLGRLTVLIKYCLGMIIASALMIWKGLICITGTESPIVVVLTGSMEPGFKRVIFYMHFQFFLLILSLNLT